MEEITLPAGTVMHINGIPVALVSDTVVASATNLATVVAMTERPDAGGQS